MNTTPRLHLVRGIVFQEDFSVEYAQFEAQATTLVMKNKLSNANVWTLAQYLDLVDAGYGSKRTALYRSVKAQLYAFVQANLHRPVMRALFGRTACLSAMFNKALKDAGDKLDAEHTAQRAAA
jgi:hypothetical protein